MRFRTGDVSVSPTKENGFLRIVHLALGADVDRLLSNRAIISRAIRIVHRRKRRDVFIETRSVRRSLSRKRKGFRVRKGYKAEEKGGGGPPENPVELLVHKGVSNARPAALKRSIYDRNTIHRGDVLHDLPRDSSLKSYLTLDTLARRGILLRSMRACNPALRTGISRRDRPPTRAVIDNVMSFLRRRAIERASSGSGS